MKNQRELLSDEDNPIIIRISTFGFSKEKKRTFIQYYMKGECNQEEIDSQFLSYEKTMQVEGEYIKITFTDSENIEKYKQIPLTSFRKEDGVVFIYDVSDETTFNKLSDKLYYAGVSGNHDYLLIGDTSNMKNVDNLMKEIENKTIGSFNCLAHYQINITDMNSVVTIMQNYVNYLISERVHIKMDCIFLNEPNEGKIRNKKKCAK